jgi:dihydroxyacetone kinase-like predicted kinase
MLHETMMQPRAVDAAAHDGTWADELEPEDEEGYGYDVQFLMRGQEFDVDKVRKDFESMGWSTLVVGDASLIKVHIHVHNPADPIGYAVGAGAALDDIVVENMQLQYEAQAAQRVRKTLEDAPVIVEGTAVIAVVAGNGLRKLMIEELGASAVVSGGQTMNPSAEDFLSVINALPNSEIVLLPNNKNIILAAEQAAKLSVTKSVRVVPSRSVPQGIAAMFAYLNTREEADFDGLYGAMRAAIASVRTGEITTSTKTITLDGVAATEGQVIGMLDGKLAAAGDAVDAVVVDVLRAGGAAQSDLITIYFGAAIREAQANRLADMLRAQFPRPEIQVVRGGQPLYPYLLGIE